MGIRQDGAPEVGVVAPNGESDWNAEMTTPEMTVKRFNKQERTYVQVGTCGGTECPAVPDQSTSINETSTAASHATSGSSSP